MTCTTKILLFNLYALHKHNTKIPKIAFFGLKKLSVQKFENFSHQDTDSRLLFQKS